MSEALSGIEQRYEVHSSSLQCPHMNFVRNADLGLLRRQPAGRRQYGDNTNPVYGHGKHSNSVRHGTGCRSRWGPCEMPLLQGLLRAVPAVGRGRSTVRLVLQNGKLALRPAHDEEMQCPRTVGAQDVVRPDVMQVLEHRDAQLAGLDGGEEPLPRVCLECDQQAGEVRRAPKNRGGTLRTIRSVGRPTGSQCTSLHMEKSCRMLDDSCIEPASGSDVRVVPGVSGAVQWCASGVKYFGVQRSAVLGMCKAVGSHCLAMLWVFCKWWVWRAMRTHVNRRSLCWGVLNGLQCVEDKVVVSAGHIAYARGVRNVRKRPDQRACHMVMH